jgi:malate dehydrogenase (oxaloacetate-decarboxylating)(NADP+)
MEITGKKFAETKVVFSGAGASGISCARQLVMLGFARENIFLVDTTGLVYAGRKEKMSPEKAEFANGNQPADLAKTLEGADILIGLSAADIVSQDMVKRMAANPVIFPMANPDPEIKYELAREARPDAIVGTGRSDFSNQINNVLGFPFIFRGALDVRARTINDEMKLAASHALADLAKEPVMGDVLKVYQLDHLEFGRDYVVPKPFDKRVCLWEAPAVAQAAIDSGVARITSMDMDAYKQTLTKRLLKK